MSSALAFALTVFSVRDTSATDSISLNPAAGNLTYLPPLVCLGCGPCSPGLRLSPLQVLIQPARVLKNLPVRLEHLMCLTFRLLDGTCEQIKAQWCGLVEETGKVFQDHEFLPGLEQ